LLNNDSSREISTAKPKIQSLPLAGQKIEEQSIFNTSPRREKSVHDENPYDNSPKISKSPDLSKHLKKRVSIGMPHRSLSQVDAPKSKIALL
jgi:hypothetical protein